jgi:hypothetical protein
MGTVVATNKKVLGKSSSLVIGVANLLARSTVASSYVSKACEDWPCGLACSLCRLSRVARRFYLMAMAR